MAKIVDYRDIPLTDLVIGTGQVRLSETSRGIDELADSIRKQGLLEPILVAPADTKGKYEIILGQRRFLAHKQLAMKTIKAGILDKHVDETTAKVLSVTENLIRRDLNRKDLIDVCTYLYKKYGSIKDVVEETGLPQSKVKDYVKYDRLMPELKQLVDKNQVDLNAALRAQDAVFETGDDDPKEAVKLAKELSKMSGVQRKKVEEQVKEDPNRSLDDVVEQAKSGEKITQIVVTLGEQAHRSLNRFAKDEQTTQDDAAASLIEESLSSKGYM